MAEKKYTWHKLIVDCKEINFENTKMKVIEIEGRKICIASYRNKIYAFAYSCPHASGVLADGFIDAVGCVVCPVHHYRFDIRNGRNTSGEGYYLKTYAVDIRGDGVYIGLEQPGITL